MYSAIDKARVLLVSTYELGHQPWHVASPAAALRAAGHEVRALDLSVDGWDPELVAWADGVAFSAVMHTAVRLAREAAARVEAQRPGLPVCFYGLYAGAAPPPGAFAIAGEYEPALVAWAADLGPAAGAVGTGVRVELGRTRFGVPSREGLPDLGRYARMVAPGACGDGVLVGAVEASHGCSHRCRHCPLPVVYDGRIRIVDLESVIADVAQLVAAGAEHITFADPDFLNGPAHSLRVVDEVHARWPHLTFDCTVKVEHVLRHRGVWETLAGKGCAFVVSAFESFDDEVLAILDKGHTAAGSLEAAALLRRHGIAVRPSLLPFTPWTTLEGMVHLADTVAANGLVGNVDPVQYTVRLLLPPGSLLLDEPAMRPHLGAYDQDRVGWTWAHPDPRVDALQERLAALVEDADDAPVPEVFLAVDAAVRWAAGAPPRPAAEVRAVREAPPVPRLTESWFCCSEPTTRQLSAVGGSSPGPAAGERDEG